jgi:alpha-L-fucosidase
MKVNGEAIYKTTASPFKILPWGRCTVKEEGPNTTLYLHVFQWPSNGQLVVPGLKNTVQSARLLGGKGAIKSSAGTEGVTLQVPTTAPDAISSTIVLKIQGAPDVEQVRITQDAQGKLTLLSSMALVHGSSLTNESKGGKDNLGFWTDSEDWADWAVTLAKPGRFRVVAELATSQPTAFTVRIGDQTLRGAAPNTGDYNTFQNVELGTVEVKTSGNLVIEVRPVTENWQPMNLRSIQLIPVP